MAEDGDDFTLVRRFCPHLAEHELRDARERFLGYLGLVARITDRVACKQAPDTGATGQQLAEADKLAGLALASDRAILASHENATGASAKEGTTAASSPPSRR